MESPRKRQKIEVEGETFNPSSAVAKAPALRQKSIWSSPVAGQIRPFSNHSHRGRSTHEFSAMHVLSPMTRQSSILHTDVRDDYNAPGHCVPQAVSQPIDPFTYQQASELFQPRAIGNPKKIGSDTRSWASTNKHLNPQWNIRMLPKAHIRSCSALSEANGSHAMIPSTQVEERKAQHSRLATANAIEERPVNRALCSIVNEVWNPIQRSSEEITTDSSSERVPLLPNVQHMAQQAGTGGHNTKRQHIERDVDGESHEGFQQIRKYRFLWFVVISIFVGIFLCLFLYAFHIIG